MNADFSSRQRTAGVLLMPALLVLASTLGSYVFACIAPLVAIATIAALGMPRSTALATVAAAWLANQAVGYGLLGYPIDTNSIGWGLAIGAASLIAAQAGRMAAARLAGTDRPAMYGAVFGVAFVAYEGALIAASLVLGGDVSFTIEIIAAVGSVNLVALVALVLLQHALAIVSTRSQALPASR